MIFTDRMEIDIPKAPITIRNDAPFAFRNYLFQLMRNYEKVLKKFVRMYVLSPKKLKTLIIGVKMIS